MDKTININLGGSLLQIDEEAFRILRDYLQAINTRFRNIQGGHETIEDIESRIAEIFQSQKGLAGVVTKENVEEMIAVIGKPEDFDVSGAEEPRTYTSERKRMYRNPDDTIISGVCGGLGAYLDIDPVLFRILFAVFGLCFGVGFLLYIILWIALPVARTDTQKREMYGGSYHSAGSMNRPSGSDINSSDQRYVSGYNRTSSIGNAFNEVFRAIGRVCFIFVRIFLIIIGVCLVLTGFLAILSFVMVFVFKYPGSFSTTVDGVNLSYIPHFLNYIFNPSVVPWITILTTLVVVLPLLAITYWGVKMIFWFKAKDGIYSLIGLVIWVMSLAALSIILFNEGVSYAEMGTSTSNNILKSPPDTLYIKPGKKIADLKYEHIISVPHEGYNVYINENNNEVFIGTYLRIEPSDNDKAMVEVKKYSYGRNYSDAARHADALQYNYSVSGDTLFLDEYFSYTPGNKWSFDDIGVTLFVPEGTILNIDDRNETMIHPSWRGNFIRDRENYDLRDGFWQWTREGLRQTTRHHR